MIRTATKPKTQRAKRALDDRAPKLIENVKKALFLRGQHTSEISSGVLQDLYALKKPEAILFQRKNTILPFEDASTLEFFSDRNDCAFFVLASHNKKRPHNLILGRFFDHHVLDMVELGIVKFKPIASFKGNKCAVGAKHSILFHGQQFEQKEEYKQIKSLFLDFYRGEALESVNLAAVDHVISITAADDGCIYFRVYNLVLKRSGTRLPRVELEEMGPSIDFSLRRIKQAAPEVMREALKIPRTIKPQKEKNIKTGVMGKTFGRIHLGQQDLSKIATRKMKGLRKRSSDDDDGQETAESSPASNKRLRASD